MRSARSGRSRLTAVTALATLVALQAPVTAAGSPTGDASPGRPCTGSRVPEGGWARDVLGIAERARAEMDLKSVILRVTVVGREVITTALGESMTGVPADPAMHFRNGSVAISCMGTALLKLVDQGKARLDDPVARWLPDLKDGERITLRMLAASTTGLVDYVKAPGFAGSVSADPFRQWTAKELMAISTSRQRLYEPGTNWSYSHADFVLLGAALEKITGTRLDVLLQREVLRPLGLLETRKSFTPDIPAPVLHAFTADRRTYEESTF
ncbi:serine hydrolase [Streptomyces europaeiscabiei]|uniref:serine hydrolase domain-containing protein n=1 Tax=Streptomyces europaeiscabiei TaxID=146819 RepID=UPI0029A52ED5|nr:serine hydrolase domain-containing protein [Streptomyces europaeiscabiei]MDX3694589.1 serine hydrolase [Streptomyces europaeiscabiei]